LTSSVVPATLWFGCGESTVSIGLAPAVSGVLTIISIQSGRGTEVRICVDGGATIVVAVVCALSLPAAQLAVNNTTNNSNQDKPAVALISSLSEVFTVFWGASPASRLAATDR